MLSFLTAALGLVGGIVVPDSGCILRDYCIKVQVPGLDNCLYLEGAVMWPAGQPELAEPVPSSHDAPGPAGCVCLNFAEQEVSDFEVPQAQFEVIMAEIEDATRDACDAIVPAGWDHNCYIEWGANASTIGVNGPFIDGYGECIGDCAYTSPPPDGSCPDPNPYECEAQGSSSGDETGAGGEDGSETGGGLGAGEHIDCSETQCDIDLDFAERLYENLDMLLTEGTTLEYEGSTGRFVFVGVTATSLAGELGLASGDELESVNGATIDDLDTALEVLADSRNNTNFRVRVKRGARWVDFTYTLVP